MQIPEIDKMVVGEFMEEELYKRWYRQAFAFTKSYVHDDLATEDIVAESLLKLLDV